MKQSVMMCFSPLSVSASLTMRSGFWAWAFYAMRRRNCPFIAKGWDISLSPNSFHSWVSPWPPSVIKFHPTSKRHTFQLAALTFPTPKEIRLLASHKAPGYPFAPVTWWFSQYVLQVLHAECEYQQASQATWESTCGSLRRWGYQSSSRSSSLPADVCLWNQKSKPKYSACNFIP